MSEQQHGAVRHLIFGLVSGLIYYGLAWAAPWWGGDLLPIPLWLATAGVVAFGVWAGREYWSAIVIGGAVVGNLASGFVLFDETVRSIVFPGASVVVHVILALFLLERTLDVERGVRRTRSSLRLLAVFAVASLVGATIATIDTASPVISERLESWERWAMGDFIGLLVLVPIVVAFKVPFLIRDRRLVAIEGGAWSIGAIAVTVLCFSVEAPILYLVFPALVWLGIRLGPRFSAPVTFAVVMVATTLSGNDSGPFSTGSLDSVLQVQLFNAALASSVFVVTATAVRAFDDQQQLTATLRALPDAALVKNEGGRLLHAWVPSELEELTAHLEPVEAGVIDYPLSDVVPGSVPLSDLIEVDGRTLEVRRSPMESGGRLNIYRDVTEVHRVRRELRIARERLQLIETTERARLGRALHDGPVQDLTAAQIRLGSLASSIPADSRRDLESVERLLSDSIAELRSASSSLAPPSLGQRPLVDELARFGASLFDGSGTELVWSNELTVTLSKDESEAFFLVGREALANAAFHSGATSVAVELVNGERRVVLRVIDDGVGLQTRPSAGRPHLGLQLMRERVESVGGSLRIDSGSGVTVEASLPTRRAVG